MTKLIIFDLDGTLLDTIQDLGDSVNEVLAARGLPQHHYDDFCYFVGDGMEMLIRRALPKGSEEKLVGEVLQEYREAYQRNWAKKSKPYEGIVELLENLKAEGVRLAVLSNKPDNFTQLCVAKLLPAGLFEKIYGQREGVPQKPDPGAAIAIARDLEVPVEHTMFVGDTDVDIRTGVGAGMVAVGVLWGFRGEEELRAAGASHIVANPKEILEIL